MLGRRERRLSLCTALIKYDAARKAIAAAHRVDEVKAIRDKAEAVRTYAKLAGDLELQNQACEIRIRAERRAGQLLIDMEKNPGTRGEGRPRKDGTKIRRSVIDRQSTEAGRNRDHEGSVFEVAAARVACR